MRPPSKTARVPISTGVTLARAAGVLGTTRAEWEPVMDHYIAHGVLLASDYDPDDILGDNPPESPGYGVLPPVPSGDGVSAARWLDVNGKHEYIAGYERDGMDVAGYSRNRMALFHRTGGKVVVDDVCIAEETCELLDAPTAELLAR